MKKFTRALCFATLTLLLCNSALAQPAFVIGVAPHTSARVILDMYQPLRNYLEKALDLPIDIVTAPDFDTLARRALSQSYDLVITTGQQARLLQTDANYTPLLTYKAVFKAVIIVSAKGPYHSTAALENSNVLGLSPTSQVTLWGRHWLNDNGLSSLPIKYVSASDSLSHLVISGEAAAGFMSLANYQKLPEEERQQISLLAESKPMAGRIYLLNGRHEALQKKIDTALWAFAETPEAKLYFDTNKLEGYRRLEADELIAMDGYAAEVRKALESSPK